MAIAGNAAVAHQAAIAQALRATGAIVQLESHEFQKILSKSVKPLVVTATGGLFSKNHQYLTSYKGLCFFCKSGTELRLPAEAEVIYSKKIWIPE